MPLSARSRAAPSLRPRGPRRGWGLGLGGGRGPEWSTQGHHSEPGPCPHCCRSSPEPALVVVTLTLTPTPTPTCTAAQAHVSSSPLLGPVLSRGRDSGMTETQALPTHGSRSHWGHEGGRRRRPDTSTLCRTMHGAEGAAPSARVGKLRGGEPAELGLEGGVPWKHSVSGRKVACPWSWQRGWLCGTRGGDGPGCWKSRIDDHAHWALPRPTILGWHASVAGPPPGCTGVGKVWPEGVGGTGDRIFVST